MNLNGYGDWDLDWKFNWDLDLIFLSYNMQNAHVKNQGYLHITRKNDFLQIAQKYVGNMQIVSFSTLPLSYTTVMVTNCV